MTENDIDTMIEELEESEIDDDGVCVRYRPYKREVPILVKALKAYKASLVENKNKMEAIAQLFGKKLGERFTVRTVIGAYCDYIFTDSGLYVDNGRLDINDHYCLLKLLLGEAVIVDD
jgi:hypothetical protein